MNPNLEQAVIQFLANEFQQNPESIIHDTDFCNDFNLTPEQVTDLITRMQDALEFVLPEEKIPQIHTVGDLLDCLQPEESDVTNI